MDQVMDYVVDIENKISAYYNAAYAVFTLSCTHSLSLCLTHTNAQNLVCPKQTSLNVPLLLIQKGVSYTLSDVQWERHYTLGNSNIIDAAVFWEPNGYINNSLMCLSFQNRKHLSVGGGGMILTDDAAAYTALKQLRDNAVSIMNQRTLNYYHNKAMMASQTFDQVKDVPDPIVTYQHYNDVTDTIARKAHIYLAAGLDVESY